MSTVMTLEKSFVIEDRNKYINRIDILSTIKPVNSLLPDGENMTIKAAAKYYEVDRGVIERLLTKFKEEFEQDGVRTITKRNSEFELYLPALATGQHALKLVSRRALLRLGMLLKDSNVAEKVRDYLVRLDVLIESEKPTKERRQRNRNHSEFYLQQKGLSADSTVCTHAEEEIHSNSNQLINDLVQQLEQFKVNTGMVNDMTLRIKELEHELKLKTILVEDQQNVIDSQKRALNKLKKENKDVKSDLKSIRKIVFKDMIDENGEKPIQTESKTFKRDAQSGLIC